MPCRSVEKLAWPKPAAAIDNSLQQKNGERKLPASYSSVHSVSSVVFPVALKCLSEGFHTLRPLAAFLRELCGEGSPARQDLNPCHAPSYTDSPP